CKNDLARLSGRPKSMCEHGHQRSECRECLTLGIGGTALCEHGKRQQICKICKGSKICVHGKIVYICSICDPKAFYKRYIRNAKDREHEFALTFEEFKNIITQPCFYCGRTAEQADGIGIDRVDSS